MGFFNPQLKVGKKPSKKGKFIKGLKAPIVTATHPISTDMPNTVVTTTEGDAVWIDAMPWRSPLTASDKAIGFDIDGIPVIPFKAVRLTGKDIPPNPDDVRLTGKVEMFDRKTYQRDLMRKRRGKSEQISCSEQV